jgi:hypothetical protein
VVCYQHQITTHQLLSFTFECQTHAVREEANRSHSGDSNGQRQK